MEGKEPSLRLERLQVSIVPDGEIGAGNLLGKGKLGIDHAIGEAGGKVTVFDEAPPLGARGAGDNDDFIEMGFG